MNPDNVTHCMRCNTDLNGYSSSRWVGDVCQEVICYECNKKDQLDDYLRTKVIKTGFLMTSLMNVHSTIKDGKYSKLEDENFYLDRLANCHEEVVKASFEVQLASLRFKRKIKKFETDVWFNGLQKLIRKSKFKGVSAKPDCPTEFCVLTYTMCGRTMFTIEDSEASITCITDETSMESCMGLQGVQATAEKGLELLDRAISMYIEGKLKFETDKEVSLI